MRRFAPPLVAVLVVALLAVLWRPWSRGPGAADTPRTILLLAIDTLRRDRVGAYRPEGAEGRGRRSLTPRIDALAASATLFLDATTPVPLTLPGHATMLSGLPPAATGVRVNAHGRIPDAATRGYPLLAERLSDAGWHTAAFVSASPLLARYGLDHGFDVYDDEGLDDQTGLTYAERPGEKTVARALAHVRSLASDERVFLFVHLFEPHAPYAPDAGPHLPPETRYDLDVARADAIAGRLLDGLGEAGRRDAAVLVTSDHGEALGELGERTHGLLLGDAVLRVPFLLRVPGRPPARRTDPVQLADVAPTLAALGGLEPWDAPGDAAFTGRSLLNGPVDGRIYRVAESLYANQRYGWAQLLGVIAPTGMLVDVGLDRQAWLARAPFSEPQAAPTDAREGSGRLGALGRVIRAYRDGERPERISGGDAAQGYGHAGRTAPFLTPQENARLDDPYAVVGRSEILDRLAHRLRTGSDPRRVLQELRQLGRRDSQNPEVAFWTGRAWQRIAERTAASEAERDAALQAAGSAYREAWRLGRKDALTLGLAVGMEAARDPASGLDLLRRFLVEVPEGARCRLLIQKARLHRALDQPAEAEATCAEARRTCESARDRRAYERATADETCR